MKWPKGANSDTKRQKKKSEHYSTEEAEGSEDGANGQICQIGKPSKKCGVDISELKDKGKEESAGKLVLKWSKGARSDIKRRKRKSKQFSTEEAKGSEENGANGQLRQICEPATNFGVDVPDLKDEGKDGLVGKIVSKRSKVTSSDTKRRKRKSKQFSTEEAEGSDDDGANGQVRRIGEPATNFCVDISDLKDEWKDGSVGKIVWKRSKGASSYTKRRKRKFKQFSTEETEGSEKDGANDQLCQIGELDDRSRMIDFLGKPWRPHQRPHTKAWPDQQGHEGKRERKGKERTARMQGNRAGKAESSRCTSLPN